MDSKIEAAYNLFFVLTILDYISTLLGLMSGISEGNKLLSALFASMPNFYVLAIVFLGLKMIILFCIYLLKESAVDRKRREKTFILWTIIIINLIYVAGVGNNIRLILSSF